jgi:hypothetical protein
VKALERNDLGKYKFRIERLSGGIVGSIAIAPRSRAESVIDAAAIASGQHLLVSNSATQQKKSGSAVLDSCWLSCLECRVVTRKSWTRVFHSPRYATVAFRANGLDSPPFPTSTSQCFSLAPPFWTTSSSSTCLDRTSARLNLVYRCRGKLFCLLGS